MSLTSKFSWALGILFLAFAVLCLRPVPIVAEEDSLVVNGVVDHVGIGGVNDVVIKLRNNNTIYYINRGYEMGLEMEDLRQQLIGQEVTIKYPDYWTPLDYDNSIRHLSKLQLADKVIFNELK